MDETKYRIGDNAHIQDAFPTLTTVDGELTFKLAAISDRSPPMLVGDSCEKVATLHPTTIRDWPDAPERCAVLANVETGGVAAFPKTESPEGAAWVEFPGIVKEGDSYGWKTARSREAVGTGRT